MQNPENPTPEVQNTSAPSQESPTNVGPDSQPPKESLNSESLPEPTHLGPPPTPPKPLPPTPSKKKEEENIQFQENPLFNPNSNPKPKWKPGVLDMPPEIEASKNIKLGNARSATNEDRENIKQKAKEGERKESKFAKYGKMAGWNILDMMTASLGITSQKSGKLITASSIRDFYKAGKEDKAELKPVFDFLEKQNPPFKRVGREDGYDSEGKPMSTWVFRGGNPETNISVSRENIGASNPESKEFFLKCVGEFAKAKNMESKDLHVSGDKKAIEDLKTTIESDTKLNNQFGKMNGLKPPETKPPETQTPQVTQQQQQTTPSPSMNR